MDQFDPGRSIEGQAVDRRYLRADTLAIRIQDHPKICALMDEFSQKVREIANQPGEKDELYQLNMQFFSLINKTEKENRK